jgi:predicted metalloendopeptidase
MIRARQEFDTNGVPVAVQIDPRVGRNRARAGADRAERHPGAIANHDFYRYANGGWLDRTQIPDGMPSFGTFEQLYVQTLDQQIELIQQMATGAQPGSDEWKAGQFFLQGVDSQTRNALGATPVMPQMELIDSANDLAALHRLFANPQFAGIPDLFNISVSPDPDDSSTAVYYLAGPRLSRPTAMPPRSFSSSLATPPSRPRSPPPTPMRSRRRSPARCFPRSTRRISR